MKITIISGSHRPSSQSDRVATYIEKELRASPGVEASIISLAGNPLPLWDEQAPTETGQWSGDWLPIKRLLQVSDGFVIVTPEWSGMVPPGLKNLFLLGGTAEFGHKPALIVAVSSGVGGSYPVQELRTSSYKNSRLCYIPEHVIIRSVADMLHGEIAASPRDEQIRQRLTYSLRVLQLYTKALGEVRASGVVDFASFPFGM